MSTAKAYSYIRFSTPEQKKGDSERRQIEAAKQYAEEHGLELDSSMRDKGLSAYHGTHRKDGDLGKFLELVEAGKIAKGSMLIIENIDRLSREKPDEVLNLFLSIIRSGITLVTLTDKRQFTPDSINENMGDLYIVIGEIYRANKESEYKSDRLSKAWKEKRNKARNGKVKLSGMSPAWLDPIVRKKDDGKTEVVGFKTNKLAKAVELIYKLKLEGFGNTRITNKLNERDDIPQPSKNGWRRSYVQKILTNKAVIGHYQPHTKVNDEREPVGDPITDYYPAVIDDDLFYAVQNYREKRREKYSSSGGRTGKARNLFVYLIKCGQCGSSMHYINKGKRQYLYCDHSRRNIGCEANPIRYDEFEQIFFANFEELDINKILPNAEQTADQISELETQIGANKQRIKELEAEEDNLVDSIAQTNSSTVRKALEKRLDDTILNRGKIEAENKDLTRNKVSLEQEATELRQASDQIKEIYDLLDSAEDEQQLIDYRLRLRAEIKRLIEKIEVYPLQETYQPEPQEVEPGIYKVFRSKYIDKVRIRFNGGDKRVLYLKRHLSTD